MNYPVLINDPRLNGYTKILRNGSQQIFYTGNDHRDFERYKAEGGGFNNVEMHDKPDTIRIQPPEKHIYAELIDGKWYWVNGCAECNGKPRDWITYIECDKHDVCAICGCSRSELTEAPWGRKHGWVCKPCADKDDEERHAAALSRIAGYEYDEFDFYGLNKITCPYCQATFSADCDDYGADSDERECDECGNTFTLTAEHTISWTTKRKEAA